MNKPARQESLEEMNEVQLKNKRSDIVYLVKHAKTQEACDWYTHQLRVLDSIVASRAQILFNFSADESKKWAPTFDEWAE